MPIAERYRIDFSPYRKDLIAQALDRMLSQHYDKCVLRQFVAAVMDEVQELYDALIAMQEMRTLHEAGEENLNVLGRIVGEPRTPNQYDESRYMFADRLNQRPGSSFVWCLNAPFSALIPVEDEQYRVNILARIFKNHTLVASVPEMERLTCLLTGSLVSYEKTGPMQADVIVPSSISATAYSILTMSGTDRRVDETFMLPYPATLSFSGYIMYVPGVWLSADRGNEQRCDSAHTAVSVPYHIGG
jgi:hypothetical protein